MPSKMRTTAMTFTVNNYREGDLDAIKGSDLYKYGLCGKEVGESGTPHLQGYVQLKKRTAWKTAVKNFQALVNNRAHLDNAKGSWEQNKAYCSKDPEADFVEWGTRPQRGKRMDLEAMRDAIKEGAS